MGAKKIKICNLKDAVNFLKKECSRKKNYKNQNIQK